jgi:phage gpG-like protein
MSNISLEILLAQKSKEIIRYVQQDAPRIIAKFAKDHAREAFANEGYTDVTLEPWKIPQRRKPEKAKIGKRGNILKRGQSASYTRPTLVGETRELRNSIRALVKNKNEVEIGSDKPYAKAHNYGTDNAGRKQNVKLPKRQFIGHSQQLQGRIIAKFERDINNLLK